MTQHQHIHSLVQQATSLLKELIAIPSFSKEEDQTATHLEAWLQSRNVKVSRLQNNVWATNLHFDHRKPTLLLNSHHDTVKANLHYTLDPFAPIEQDGKLFGLGSNDAGGSLVSLAAAFLHFYPQEQLKYNLIFAATAEEEISGKGGIELLLPQLGVIECAIVGEPTLLQLAVAEKGLMVLDATVTGVAGHAAREEGENAIYKALKDIEWFRQYQFPKVSSLLGPVKMSVTLINAGTQHNVVPAACNFVVDVRVNEWYPLEELLEIIRSNVSATITPRSLRLRATAIAMDHPLVKAGMECGGAVYGSPTLSDKALMPFPALKMGPGDSARSHTADEFIYTEEIGKGIEAYIALMEKLLL
jgi:acetylornithine deacetylase